MISPKIYNSTDFLFDIIPGKKYKINEIKQQEQNNISLNQKEETDAGGSKVQNIFNKLKNIKLNTPSFGKKDSAFLKI